MMTPQQTAKTRVALVVPHIFMHRDILPRVIFSPGRLAIQLAEQLQASGTAVTLYTPGPVDTDVPQVNTDLSYFEKELAGRGDSYIDLLRKHPFTFVTLARQVQSELIAAAYRAASDGLHDIVHIYTNEEDTALPFASLCQKPVVFTHHDPYNFLVKYKNVFPKYKHLNFISMSYAQRRSMPQDTNWIANSYHGLDLEQFRPVEHPTADYVAYLGRIIEPKGVHLAIAAVRAHNHTAAQPLTLKIAGKHYSESAKDAYWQTKIAPELDGMIEYVGFINDDTAKNDFLGNARALIVPSLFDEPFGMVMIEALACGTPLIGLDSGAIPEIITRGSGICVAKQPDPVAALADAIRQIDTIDRMACRRDFEQRFTLARMAGDHINIYHMLQNN